MSLHPNFPYPRASIGRALAQRWCTLAETRLDYLTELFESGRWRRFHSEVEFLDNIQEAKDAVARWRLVVEDETVAVRQALSGSVIYRAPRALVPRAVAAPDVSQPIVTRPVDRAPVFAKLSSATPVIAVLEAFMVPSMSDERTIDKQVSYDECRDEPQAEAAAPVLIPIETLLRQAPRRPAVTPSDLDWQTALDPDSSYKDVGERYPMLRTAM